jgi:hypothetical protein
MSKLHLLSAAILAITLTSSGVVLAEGKHTGFDSETTGPTNGNGGNDNGNLTNEGTSSTETTGPKGQLKQDNTDCNNCETTVDLPGRNR